MEPLGICRTAFYVSKKIMCAVLIVFSLRGRAQSSVMMEKETCAFLQSLPADGSGDSFQALCGLFSEPFQGL